MASTTNSTLFPLERPALAPPPGITPDFEHPGGIRGLAQAFYIISCTLCVLAVGVRLYSRSLINNKFGIQDVLLFPALGLLTVFKYMVYMNSIFPGILVHQWNMQLATFIEGRRRIYFAIISYNLGIMLLKVIILLDWLALFSPAALGHQGRRRSAVFWVCHVLIWVIIVSYIIGTLLYIFQCTPIEKAWMGPLVSGPGARCPIDVLMHLIVSGVLNAVTDAAILILPLRMIWRLNVSRRKKVGMSVVFGVGVFATVAAIMRLVMTVRLISTKDVSYVTSQMGLWGSAELTAGFLVIGSVSVPRVAIKVAGSRWAKGLLTVLTCGQRGGAGKDDPGRPVVSSLSSWYYKKRSKRPQRDQWHLSEFTLENSLSTRNLTRVEAGADESGQEGGSSIVVTRDVEVEEGRVGHKTPS